MKLYFLGGGQGGAGCRGPGAPPPSCFISGCGDGGIGIDMLGSVVFLGIWVTSFNLVLDKLLKKMFYILDRLSFRNILSQVDIPPKRIG